jgi:hypothetical protein
MKVAAVPSILIAVVLLAVAVIAEAQQPKKVPRFPVGIRFQRTCCGNENRQYSEIGSDFFNVRLSD